MRVAIFPARGGSRRIPRKNVRPFRGRPVLAWALDAARESGLFEHLVVSTEDREIAELAATLGAEVPFLRPLELADDHASTDDVLLHAVGECLRRFGPIEVACCIYPTSPLLAAADLVRGLRMLEERSAPSAVPMVRYEFPIEQAFALRDGTATALDPAKLAARSQDLEPKFHDAGCFYWLDVARFVESKALFVGDMVGFEVDRERYQDINDEGDWRAAELKFDLLARRDS